MYQGIHEESIKTMDERVLKWITVLLGILTVVVCTSLYYFPDLHAKAVLAAQQKIQEDNVSGELVRVEQPDEIVEAEANLDAQLHIELPKELAEDQISIENNYLTQTISVRFEKGVDDYFSNYSVKGSSDHIASLSYYKDGSEGVLALELDAVYELGNKQYEKGNLYLDFLTPHDVYDKVVVVDAGHGGRAPGAVKQGVSEKNIDLAILLELKELFDEDDSNIGVYYTRTSDVNPTLDQRVELANKSQADLFVSIHNNSSASGSFTRTNGTQVLFSESDESELSSRKFAQICLDNVVDTLGSQSRGLLKGDSIYIIRTSEAPVALIEVGFMTNYDELDKLKNSKYQAKAAKGIYHAIKEAFEEGY